MLVIRLPSTFVQLLRLLGLRGRPAKGRAELMSELGLRGEDRESAVTFASSISDSDEEEDDLIGGTPPRPTLRSGSVCIQRECSSDCVSLFPAALSSPRSTAAWSACPPLPG